jgi:Ran GTPase-activating protein (RanGAP) involved in mRNA processing and transport
MKNKNLLIIDYEINMIKNNPSAICLFNKHNYYQYLENILISPGSVFAFKDINFNKKNKMNTILMEFLGNYLNPYDHIKLSPKENLKFNDLHVDNQKNKFIIEQDKILEYFSEAILYNKSLKNLDLSDNKLDEYLFEKLYKCLKYNTNIIKLNLSNNNFGSNYSKNYPLPNSNTSFKKLREIINSNIFIENLIIKNIYLRDFGLNIIQDSLCINKSLKVLDISSNLLTFESTETLGNIINKNISIKELDISSNKIFNQKEKISQNFFSAFKINNSLISLNLTNCGIDIFSIFSLLDSLRINTALDCLNLSENKLEDYEICSFWSKIKNDKINFSKLYFNQMGKISLEASQKIFEFLCENKNLLYLGLNENNIEEEMMTLIFNGLKENKNLNEIDLRNNKSGIKIVKLFGDYLSSTCKGNLNIIKMKGNFKKTDVDKNYDYLSELLIKRYVENDITDLLPD